MPPAEDPELIATTDGRVPGRRGLATRQRLLECTAELLVATPWRSIKVIDIARQAGTSPATFYQYFENVEAAITVLAEELVEGVGVLAGLVDGDWSEGASWNTAVAVVEGFMDYWERNRAVFRVVELTTVEGDLRFQGLRVRALNAVTVTLARVIATHGRGLGSPAGRDPMAAAGTLIAMLAQVAGHRYGFEFWGIRTASLVDSQARLLHWSVTGSGRPGRRRGRRGGGPTTPDGTGGGRWSGLGPHGRGEGGLGQVLGGASPDRPPFEGQEDVAPAGAGSPSRARGRAGCGCCAWSGDPAG